ncbi:MAG: hypothetical protein JSR17_08730 [Proteobacteria bacterium]|nr:hypothetical protein [Pseudomonadota bacterium]
MNLGPELTQNPEEIRFTQESISPTLSKPKPGEKTAPHLDALVALLNTGKQRMTDFPACEIFSIEDPLTQEVAWFSLNNRKLYLAKKSHAPQMNTQLATFAEILGDTWKYTSTSDGYNYPKLSSQSDKASVPTGLLGQFRLFLEAEKATFDTQTPAGMAQVYDDAVQRFHLTCKR